MDEENATQETEQEWMPPELVERARQTAERDAGSLQKLEAKRTKRERRGLRVPPAGKHKGLSAAYAVLNLLLLAACAVLSFFGPFAAAGLERAGSLASILGLFSLAAIFALFLAMLLPVPPRSYRPLLTALLAAALLLSIAQSIAASLHSPSEDSILPPLVNAISSTLIAALLSPLPWLLLGALRRRNLEKLAALFLGINLGISLLFTGLQLLVRLAQPETELTMTPLMAFGTAQNLFFFLLLISWPILSRPIFSNSGEENPDNERQREETK